MYLVGARKEQTEESEKRLGVIDDLTGRLIAFGFASDTIMIASGAIWAHGLWGRYWGWDPIETWSLVSWLVFLAYFHFRYMFGKKQANINSLLAILGMIAIVITLLWANLSRLFSGQHSYA